MTKPGVNAPAADDDQPGGGPYVPAPGTPGAVLVDIDGTVALYAGVRDPYDTARCHLDEPNPAVIEAVRMEAAAGNVIVFCSGRSETFREVTLRWLRQHVITDGMVWELLMRPVGASGYDSVIKLELFDQHVRDRYDVRRVYDDRRRVVEAWRSIGLTVFQVAPGNF